MDNQQLPVQVSSITFFQPLKEEGVLRRSSVFQTVLGLFNSKTEIETVESLPTEDKAQDDKVQNSEHPERRSADSHRPTKYGENSGIEDSMSSDMQDLNEMPRPHTLGIRPVYKRKELDHGSEVEVRLRHFSAIFRDIPKLLGNSQQQRKDSLLQDLSTTSSDTSLRQFWMPDEHCHQCYECGDRFTTFKRRHHCRICGHIFCNRCCEKLVSGHFIGYTGMLRSCTYCYNLLMNAPESSAVSKMLNNSSVTSDHEGFHENSQDTAGTHVTGQSSMSSLKPPGKPSRSRSLVSIHGSPTDENTHHPTVTSPLHDSNIWTSPFDVFDVTPAVGSTVQVDGDDVIDFSSDTNQLCALWERIVDDKDGLEFRDHRFRLRKFSQTITGSELVEWLIKCRIAATREQACAVGQALLDTHWIKNVVDDRVFHDAYCLYQHGQASYQVHDQIHYSSTPGTASTPQVKIGTPQSRSRVSLDHAFALESEPKWVREIENDDGNDLTMLDDEDSFTFWPTDISETSIQLSHLPTEVLNSDEDSASSVSARSLASYVEIDNERNVIKYKRPTNRVGDGSSHAGMSPQHTGLMPPRFVDNCLTEISADYLRNFLAWNGTYLNNLCVTNNAGWHGKDLQSLPVSTHAKQTFVKLKKIYFRHAMIFLNQLLKAEQLDVLWADILVPLVRRVCDVVVTHPETSMNICHYVHVKKLLDGSPHESHLVNGVVFTKSVVHSQMKTLIDNPVIMLIATPLEYQRIHNKFCSLEPIVDQETEFYKNLVSRILKRNPDVVISQCTVSHKARQLFRDAGIALVINVKPSVMERLARCTGADVARSVDQLQTVKLGTCFRFRLSQHYDGQRKFNCSDGILAKQGFSGNRRTNSYKSLLYLEGCSPAHGCTVILRDSPSCNQHANADFQSRSVLSRVKDVFQFLLKVMYHGRLEISYLMDQQDMAACIPVSSRKDKRLKSPSAPLRDWNGEESQDNSTSSTEASCGGHARAESSTHASVTDDPDSTLQGTSPVVAEHPQSSSAHQNKRNEVQDSEEETDLVQPSVTTADAIKSTNAFLESINRTLLSMSPLIEHQLPYLLSAKGKSSPLQCYLPSTMFWSDLFCADDPSGRAVTKCIRHRTASTDELDVTDDDSLSFQNRSAVVSNSLQQNLWKREQRQKATESDSASSNAAVGVTSADVETKNTKRTTEPGIYNLSLKEKENVAPVPTASLRISSQNWAKSSSSKDELRLSAWEKQIIQEVLSDQPIVEFAASPSLIGHEEAENEGTWSENENKMWISQKHAFVSSSLSKPADSGEMMDLLANFRACGSALHSTTDEEEAFGLKVSSLPHTIGKLDRRVNKETRAGTNASPTEPLSVAKKRKSHEHTERLLPLDCLSPRNHQHIFVLFSSYSFRSPNAPYPCVNPWAVDIDFYHGNDITLGRFLERYCFRPSYHCTNEKCKRPMVEHVRSFVHGTTCLNIVLKELSKPVPVPYILSWCWNPRSETSTDLKPLSRDAWSMSFAKFLEIRLQGSKVSQCLNIDSSSDDVSVAPFASFQFFLMRDIVAAFKCYEVSVFDIALPPLSIKFVDKTNWRRDSGATAGAKISDYRRLVHDMNKLSKMGYEAMDSIYDMVGEAKSHSPFDHVTSDSSDTSVDDAALNQMRENYFEELLATYHEDRCRLRDSVDKLYLKLQSVRINCHTEDAEKSASHSSCQTSFDGSFEKDSIEQSIADGEKVEMSPTDQVSLSAGLLELSCLLTNLVNDWNSKISSVMEQDRVSKRGGKASILYYVSQSSTVGKKATAKSVEQTSSKKSNPMIPIVEASEEDLVEPHANDTGPFVMDDDVISTQAELSTSVSSKVTSTSDCDAINVPTNSVATDGLLSAKDSSPSQRAAFEKLSGVKRLSRTASSMTFLVNHLLPSSSFNRVKLPFPSDEHYLLPNCTFSQVVVRDSEPSSIIAYALHSPDYRQFLSSKGGPTAQNSASNQVDGEIGESTRLHVREIPLGEQKLDVDSMNPVKDVNDPFWIEFKGSGHLKADSLKQSSSQPSSPSASNSPHIEIQFSDSTTKFYCKVYFAREFITLRKEILQNGEDAYMASLSRCVRWVARGGKSGSAFHKTFDDRLVLKQMSSYDHQSFMELAPGYFEYMTAAIRNKSPTALSKVLGVYRVSFHNASRDRSFKQDVLVMENLFYKRHITQVYDLKGSVRNRHVKTDTDAGQYNSTTGSSLGPSDSDDRADPSKTDVVLMDENLLNIMRDRPLYVHEHAKFLIKKALTADTSFLLNHRIIDYSLLVGMDEEKKEIVVGIIDYMRAFTWDKKLEMIIKSAGMAGRLSTRSMPTVVSPEKYRSRFCEAMDSYFQVVPDRWYEMPTYRSDAGN